MKRRSFLKSLLAFLGITTLFSFVYPLFRFLSPESASAKFKKVELRQKEIPMGEAFKTRINNTPVIVINHPNKGYIALSRVCTHLGCLVDYDRSSGRLICPCHGANFTVEGRVISGPAPKALERIPLLVQDDKVLLG